MNDPHGWYTLAAILGLMGLWLLLPPGRGRRRWLGALPLAAAGGLILGQGPWLQSWAAEMIYGSMAAAALVGAVGTVVSRQPIYSAAWFALSIAGAAGLMLVNWAEFLAVAVLIVYAGAILVMFLFVLMLSQPDGRAAHDRNGWEPLVSAATGAVLVGVLTMNIVGGTLRTAAHGEESGGDPAARSSALARETSAPHSAAAAPNDKAAPKHAGAPSDGSPIDGPAGKGSAADAGKLAARSASPVAPADGAENRAKTFSVGRLGAELFSRHLVAVEVAGVLLLVALVAAAVIVGHVHRHGLGGP